MMFGNYIYIFYMFLLSQITKCVVAYIMEWFVF